MKKICPRCKTLFECQHDNLSDCHCGTVTLDKQQLAYIGNHYNNCLCNSCLQEIKYGFYAFGVNPKFKNTKIQ